MVEEKQVVKSNSPAYGYNYASLADIVNQGFKLPIMETRTMEGQTFMGWLDEDKNWHQGAPIIVPEMKGMNAAQAMGSALTYARRYTAQMALGLACDDDAKLEKAKPTSVSARVYSGGNKVDFNEIRAKVALIDSIEDLEKYWNELHLSSKQLEVVKPIFSKRRALIMAKEQHGVE